MVTSRSTGSRDVLDGRPGAWIALTTCRTPWQLALAGRVLGLARAAAIKTTFRADNNAPWREVALAMGFEESDSHSAPPPRYAVMAFSSRIKSLGRRLPSWTTSSRSIAFLHPMDRTSRVSRVSATSHLADRARGWLLSQRDRRFAVGQTPSGSPGEYSKRRDSK